MYKYVVEDEEQGKYLGKKYYIGERETFFSEAYRFSAFELKLAKSVLLKPTERYRVYQIEEKNENIQ